MKKTNIILIAIMSAAILFTSCNSKKNESNINLQNKQNEQLEETSQITKKEETGEKKSLSYQEYRKLYDLIKNNLKMEGFKQIYNSDGATLIAVDKEFTFNKRRLITLYGDGVNTTQDTICFESQDKNTLLSINLAYTTNYIGNDLVYYMPSVNDDLINSNLKNLTDYMIISYKNLVIDIHQTNTTKVDKTKTKSFAKMVIEILLKNNDQ